MVLGARNYAFDDQDKKGNSEFAHNGVQLSGFTDGVTKYPAEKEAEAQKENKEEAFFKVPGRKYIIEPAVLMIHCFHIGSFSLTSQYIYYAIGEKYNLSAWMAAAAEEEKNGTGSGVCGSSDEIRNSTAYQLQQAAQAETARFNFYMDLVNDIPGIFLILFYGSLIDKLGRKPGLIIPLAGIIVRALIYVMQMTLRLPVEVLLLTGVTDALTGGMGTYMSACYAYYADTIPPRNRARRVAIADVVSGLSLSVVSPLIGITIENYGFFAPFCFIIPGYLINMMYIIFFVPESRSTGATKKNVSPRYFYQSFKVLLRERPNNGRKRLYIFVTAWLIIAFARGGMRLETIYKLNSPFCWTPTTMGIVSSLSSLVTNGVQMFVAGFLIKPLGDVNVILMSLMSNIGDQVLTGLATKSWMLYLAPAVGSLAAMQFPMFRAIMSRIVEQGEQGSLYSCLSAIDKVLGIGASSFFSFVYAETLYFFKGTIFIIMAILLSIAWMCVLIFRVMDTRTTKVEVEVAEDPKDMTKF